LSAMFAKFGTSRGRTLGPQLQHPPPGRPMSESGRRQPLRPSSPRRPPSRSERRQPLRPSFASATAVQVRAASTPSTVFASATTVQVSTASTVFASATALAHTHRRPDDRAVLPVNLADIAHRLVMRRTSSSTMGTRSKASLSWGTLESRVETPIAPFGSPSTNRPGPSIVDHFDRPRLRNRRPGPRVVNHFHHLRLGGRCPSPSIVLRFHHPRLGNRSPPRLRLPATVQRPVLLYYFSHRSTSRRLPLLPHPFSSSNTAPFRLPHSLPPCDLSAPSSST